MKRLNSFRISLAILVCIFSIAKAQSPIQPPEGMISWWPGDGSAEDIVGWNSGSLWGNSTYSTGKVGDAFYFPDSTCQVWAPAEGIDDLQELTIDLWVRLDSIPEHEISRFVTIVNSKAVLRYDGINGPRQLHFFLRFEPDLPGGGFDLCHIRVDNVLNAGVWHHVAGTYDGSIMRLYLDGEQVGSAERSGVLHVTGPGAAVVLGSDYESLYGLLDEVEIYNRALSAEEVRAIYDAGSAGKCKVAVPVILNFFDESVDDGSLVGEGLDNSAKNRLNALRNILETAADLIEAGDYEEACDQLLAAYKKTDGNLKPPDFVSGPSASELAIMILDLIASLGCE